MLKKLTQFVAIPHLTEDAWELLKKQAKKFETQQRALELALESLENSSKQSPALTLEEKYWMRIKWAKSAVIIEKNAFKFRIETTDVERLSEIFSRDKTIEYTIEFYFQKPLEECTLKEVIDGLVINLKITNWFDTVDYTDSSGEYKLIMTHFFGFNFSKIIRISIENMFKTYGVKTDSIVSVKTIFMRISKN